MSEIKYFSMFSGIGGFEIGIQNAYGNKDRRSEANPPPKSQDGQGLQSETREDPSTPKRSTGTSVANSTNARPLCIGYSEIDKYANKVYERHFKHENYGDATRIDTSRLPEFNLLVGGFPCQAFSIAGKRGGFSDTRGTLFFDVARILKDKKPSHLVLENVKGLLSHDSGKTFQTILTVLANLGYRVEWMVLNSKNFGVPQNRERVFIIGHLGNGCRSKIFPITGTDSEDIRIVGQDVSYTIDANYHKGTNTLDKSRRSLVDASYPRSSGYREYRDIAPTVRDYGSGGNKMPMVMPVLTPDRTKKRQNGRRFKEDGEPSFTVNTQDRHGIFDGIKIRRLTPLECERLMAYPDNWTKYGVGEEPISDTQRYKMCGNGIVSNVVEAVMERLVHCYE
jgi:DNA (cytosine-5)-methyltransferase 1